MFSRRIAGAALVVSAAIGAWQQAGTAQGALTVSGAVTVSGQGTGVTDRSDVVIWLSPAGDTPRPRMPQGRRFRIDQQNKRFQPHVLVVPVGSAVDFPNLDPIFHNVFSLFDGKRFDLGLYEAGTTRGVNLTRAGVCYVFCNIHPEMSAVVVAVDSPYYAASAANGSFAIADVPPGRYRLSVWHERFKPEDATEFPKDVTLAAGSATLAPIRMVSAGRVPAAHTNKFGHGYTPPSPASPAYP